jgi:hypothetical protein
LQRIAGTSAAERKRAVSRANFAHLGCENEVDLKGAHARAKVGIGQNFYRENVADCVVDRGGERGKCLVVLPRHVLGGGCMALAVGAVLHVDLKLGVRGDTDVNMRGGGGGGGGVV